MKRFVGPVVIALLIAANLAVASQAFAHQWGNWHWNRSGSSVTIRAYNYAEAYGGDAASYAISDWSNNTILYVPEVNYHTDMSVYDGYFGNTGWGGLASIESANGWHITHGHARVNLSYGYGFWDQVGIHCQEVGHLFGLTHSNDGCMGKGYYNNLNGTVSHNHSDIYNMYRWSHH